LVLACFLFVHIKEMVTTQADRLKVAHVTVRQITL